MLFNELEWSACEEGITAKKSKMYAPLHSAWRKQLWERITFWAQVQIFQQVMKFSLQKLQKSYFITCEFTQGRIKGGLRGNCPGPPVMIIIWIKYSFEKLSFRSDTRLQICIPMLHWVYLLISLQVWLSTSFSNDYWMQIFSVLFNANLFEFCLQLLPNNRSFDMVWLSTRASHPLHKCREHDTICVLKLVLLWLLFIV